MEMLLKTYVRLVPICRHRRTSAVKTRVSQFEPVQNSMAAQVRSPTRLFLTAWYATRDLCS